MESESHGALIAELNSIEEREMERRNEEAITLNVLCRNRPSSRGSAAGPECPGVDAWVSETASEENAAEHAITRRNTDENNDNVQPERVTTATKRRRENYIARKEESDAMIQMIREEQKQHNEETELAKKARALAEQELKAQSKLEQDRMLKAYQRIKSDNEERERCIDVQLNQQRERERQEFAEQELARQQQLLENKLEQAPAVSKYDEILRKTNYRPELGSRENTAKYNIDDETSYDREIRRILLENVNVDDLLGLKQAMEPEQSSSQFEKKLGQIRDREKQIRVDNVRHWEVMDKNPCIPVNKGVRVKPQVVRRAGPQESPGLQSMEETIKRQRRAIMDEYMRGTSPECYKMLEHPGERFEGPALLEPPSRAKMHVDQPEELTQKAVSAEGVVRPRPISPARGRAERPGARGPETIPRPPTRISHMYIRGLRENRLENCREIMQIIDSSAPRKALDGYQAFRLGDQDRAHCEKAYNTVRFDELE